MFHVSQKTAVPPLEVTEPSGCSVDWGMWWLQTTRPSLGYEDKTWGMCFFWWSRLVAGETACKIRFVTPPKGIFWSLLASTLESSPCLRQLMFPQAPPSRTRGWQSMRVEKPIGKQFATMHFGMHRDAPRWRTKLGSGAGTGGMWQAWWVHGTVCPGPVVSAQTPTQLNFLRNWLNNAGSAGGRAWVWSLVTEIGVSDKKQGPNFH